MRWVALLAAASVCVALLGVLPLATAEPTLEAEVAELRAAVADLRAEVAALQARECRGVEPGRPTCGAAQAGQPTTAWAGGAARASGAAPGIPAVVSGGVVPAAGPLSGKTLARRRETWHEHIRLLAAVKADAPATAVHLLPQDGGNGLSRYVAIGDARGKLYVFRPRGDLVVEHQTTADSAITAFHSFTVRRNETTIVTGHADGSLLLHKMVEKVHKDPSLPEPVHVLTVAPRGQPARLDSGKHVSLIEGARVAGKRTVAAADDSGRVTLIRGDTGESLTSAHSPHRVLALKATASHVVFVTERGAGALDVKTGELRSVECRNLNGTQLEAVRFDSAVASKAHALSLDGELLALFVSADKKRLDCSARARRSLGGIQPPFAIATIKSYLLLATAYEVAVLNTTGPPKTPPRDVLVEPLESLAAEFMHHADGVERPVVVTNRARQVAIAFPDGIVAMYESELPVQSPPELNTSVWSQPVFVALIVCIALWQFYSQRGASTPPNAFAAGAGRFGSGGVPGGADFERELARFQSRRAGTGLH